LLYSHTQAKQLATCIWSSLRRPML